MTYLSSYHDLQWEPLLGHPVKLTLFCIWLSSCSSFWGTPFNMWVRFSYGRGWLGLHIRRWMIWYYLVFWPTTHLMPYWGIFPFQLRFVGHHWLHDHPHLWDTHRADDLISFCPDSPMEPFLSHSVRLMLSDIIVILGWSYPRCIDSHIIIAVEYMSDLLYIPWSYSRVTRIDRMH